MVSKFLFLGFSDRKSTYTVFHYTFIFAVYSANRPIIGFTFFKVDEFALDDRII